MRVNTLRTSPEALLSRLAARGFALEALAGLPSLFTVVEEPYPISQTLEHWLGLFYLQQAATGLAALALAPRPGDHVLDLCAAPGGKAAHLVERMGGRGLVVAGDNSPGRMRALLGNLYRLGHTGVLGVSSDGRAFPGGALFDRAIVDVPCSGEGNPRRRRGSFSSVASSEGFRAHITGVQRALLRRAVDLVRPGGSILYVTCTSAAEENEAVVARALARLPLSIEPIDLDLSHDRGVTQVGGRALPAELGYAWRVGPEHVGSGNLFMARLRREPDPARAERGEGWTPVPRAFDPGSGSHALDERALEDALSALAERMGVSDDALPDARWMIRGDSVWLHAASEWPLDAWRRDAGPTDVAWRFLSLGVRAFQQESSGWLRPTNDLLRVLDSALRERTVDLEPEEALLLLAHGESSTSGTSDGYVALRLDGAVIGRGFVRGGRVRSEVPRPEAKMLAEVLRASRGTARR